MKNWMKAVFSIAAMITVPGCTGYGVTFESAPGTELSNCHPALVGDWRIIEGERNAPLTDTSEFLSVNADCSNIFSVTIKNKPGKLETKVDDLKNNKDHLIKFSSAGDRDYVVVTPKETSFEISPDIKLPSGKIIYLINPGKDGVILRTVDLDKTAQLVLKRKISGQMYFDLDNPETGQKTSNIYVRGDAKQIAGYLGTLDLYSDDRLLLVPTSPAEVKQIRKAIRNFHQDKKSK